MSKLQEALERGEFAVTAEMAPPKGTDLSHLLECAKMCVEIGRASCRERV